MAIRFCSTSKKLILEIPCDRNLNILAHAQLEELDLGSTCGGHGFCGKDRIQILADPKLLSPVTSLEKNHLRSDQLQIGWRLACQTWPETDVTDIQILI